MNLDQILEVAGRLAVTELAPRAAAVDRQASWPEEGIRALLAAGLGGLVVPRRHGGLGQGLYGLNRVCEVLGKGCPSAALCFGMHAVGSAVIAAKATTDQQARLLVPIAAGEHLTTLALSEPGSGAHFYLPASTVSKGPDGSYLVSGEKSFVTNGGHADSYVVSVVGTAPEAPMGQFSCVVVPADSPGMRWQEPWRGFGMRGNASGALRLEAVAVPANNLLGEEGDQLWYAFQVVAPYFLMAMTGVYLGIAARVIDELVDHMRGRTHSHDGRRLAQRDVLQHRLAALWARLEATRRLSYHAASEYDAGNPDILPAVLSAKAEVADCCVEVCNDAMTLAGGRAYGADSVFSRMLRDARAAHVMAPTTDMLRLWAGRSLLGEPLLRESDD